MGRKRTGSIYTKDGALWYALQLRSGKRHARRVPPLPDGRAATEAQARTYVAELIRRHELGLWDPEAPDPARPGAAPPAAPVPTVAEFGRRWVDALTHASKGNEDIFLRRHVEGTELGAKPIMRNWCQRRGVAYWRDGGFSWADRNAVAARIMQPASLVVPKAPPPSVAAWVDSTTGGKGRG